jgi:endonuclease/exonuclease/phosphatase family metal-dependent hydrolase
VNALAGESAGLAIRLATFNIHKGFSHFNLRLAVHDVRERLRALDADIVCLQEVQGRHQGHRVRHPDWPGLPQHEFLAESVWPAVAYGRNAVYEHGHHGNAILSRYPIRQSENIDVSAHRFEQRGLLHSELQLPGGLGLHVMCVHLALNERGRRHQIAQIIARVHAAVPRDAPLVVAGDFNDWRGRAGAQLAQALDLHEVFHQAHGRSARSFPAPWPLLRLDRIYVRGLEVRETAVHHGLRASRLSDHALLAATLGVPGGH